MPLDKYFKGHGAEVMSSMQKKYGAEKGKEVFYATANKKGMTGRMADLKKKGKFKKEGY